MTMTPLSATDSRQIPYSPEAIWPVLADIKRYPQWWPKTLFPRVTPHEEGLVSSILHLRPMGMQPVTCIVREVILYQTIELEYVGNFITGHAQWQLTPQPQGTRVSYILDVHLHGILPALLSRVLNLQPFHSFSLRKILAELEHQVQLHAHQRPEQEK